MTKIIRAAMISVALGVSFASFGVGEAVAGALEDGSAAYDAGDYATALTDFKLAAQAGSALAQRRLGGMYFIGKGVTQDRKEAIKWFRLAAAQGSAEAQFILGNMYGMGQGVAVDLKRSYMWFQLAAALGDEGAARALNILENSEDLQTADGFGQAEAMAAKCQASNYKDCGE